jgi:MSHA biogenesis protein MshP
MKKSRFIMKRISTMCRRYLDLMRPAHLRLASRKGRRQTGFAIVSAIFLLVILALLGAYMVNFSTVQNTTSGTDVEGSRAYWAARSGLDWGIYKARVDNLAYACSTGCVMATPPCTGPTTVTPAATNLTMAGYTVTVSCTCTPSCQANTPIKVFRFTSNACNQANAGSCPNPAPTGTSYVDRELTAIVPQ